MISHKNLPEEFTRFHGKSTYFHICPLGVMPQILKGGLRCDMGEGYDKNKIFLGDTIATCCDLLPDNATVYKAWLNMRNIISKVKLPSVREYYAGMLRPIYKAAAILAVDMSGIECELYPRGVQSVIQTVRECQGNIDTNCSEKYLTEYVSRKDIEPERMSCFMTVQFFAQSWEKILCKGWSYESDNTIPDRWTIIIE